MAEENNEVEQFDHMSDEDFLKMPPPADLADRDAIHADPDQEEQIQQQKEVKAEETPEGDTADVQPEVNADPADNTEDKDASANNGGAEIKPGEAGNTDESQSDPENAPNEQEKPENGEKEEEKKPDADKKESGDFKLPEGVTGEQVTSALAFYTQITAPFKADGKDFTVRSPEDAIRLMQQGVNYSRRMQEIKPLKAMNRMLQDHGLADTTKLNYLIDLSKGNKEAVTKLLKDHKIDPMDLDVETEVSYQGNNYAGNSQENEFREALDNTVAIPEGKALVQDIQKWDSTSKAKLMEDPSIIGNLTEQKQSGVYDKVVAELEYQRSIGHLTGTPFLQAYDQVGEAMAKAGVFNQPAPNPAPAGVAPIVPGNTPLDSGVRKAAEPKKPAPNPHLSSTPPSKQKAAPKPVDYSSLSDEDFLKMAPPS